MQKERAFIVIIAVVFITVIVVLTAPTTCVYVSGVKSYITKDGKTKPL